MMFQVLEEPKSSQFITGRLRSWAISWRHPFSQGLRLLSVFPPSALSRVSLINLEASPIWRYGPCSMIAMFAGP